MKRFLSAISILLTVVMLATVAPLSVFAADTPVYGTAADFALNNSDKVNVIYAPTLSGNSSDNNLAKIDGVLSEADPWYNSSYTMVGTSGCHSTTSVLQPAIDSTTQTYYYAQDESYIYLAAKIDFGAVYGADNTTIENYIKGINQTRIYFDFDLNGDVSDIPSNMMVGFYKQLQTYVDTETGLTDLTNDVKTWQTGVADLVAKIVGCRMTKDGETIKSTAEFYDAPHMYYYEIAIDKKAALNRAYGEGNTEGKTLNGVFFRFEANGLIDKDGNGSNTVWNAWLNGSKVDGVSGIHNAGTRAFPDFIVLNDKNTSATTLGHTMTDAYLVSRTATSETEGTATFYHSHKLADGKWDVIDTRTFDATYTKDGDVYTYTAATTQQHDDTHHWEGCACGGIVGEKELHDEGNNDADCTKNVVCSCGKVTKAGNVSHTPEADDGDVTTPVKCQNCSTILTPGYKYGLAADYMLDNLGDFNAIYVPEISDGEKIDGKLDADDPWYNYGVKYDNVISVGYPEAIHGDKDTTSAKLRESISTTYRYAQDDEYIYMSAAMNIKPYQYGGKTYMPTVKDTKTILGFDLGNQTNLIVPKNPAYTDYLKSNTELSADGIYVSNGVAKFTKVMDNTDYYTDAVIYLSRYDKDGNLVTTTGEMTEEYTLYQTVVLKKTDKTPDAMFLRFYVNQVDYYEVSGTTAGSLALMAYTCNLSGVMLGGTYYPDLIVLNNGITSENVEHTLESEYLVSDIPAGSTEGTAELYHSVTIKNLEGKDDWKAIYPTTYKMDYTADGVAFSDASYAYDVKYDVSLTDSDADKAPTCEFGGLYFKSCSCGVIGEGTEQTFTVDALSHDEETVRYNSAEGKHWLECDVCNGEGVEKVAHVFDKMDETAEYLVAGSVADCTNGAQYYKHCVCGLASTDTADIFEGSSKDMSLHNYSVKFFYNDSYHWNECTRCGATNAVSAHTFVAGSCSICKYLSELPSTPPTTEAPTTEAPTTEAPTTEAPTTEAPTTEAPTTEAPTTEAPTTEAPTTEAPTTEAPTTEAPTTEAPTTEAPTTEAPATEAPTTEAPAEGGCNGAISFAGLAIVTMIGTCAVVATKKKED